jgi:hypothetical protein
MKSGNSSTEETTHCIAAKAAMIEPMGTSLYFHNYLTFRNTKIDPAYGWSSILSDNTAFEVSEFICIAFLFSWI